jgi:nicotinate-nucleotide adenylyltransferase
MRHPRVRVTDLEVKLGTRFTYATLAAMVARYPGVRFVWLMGADNLASFHKWENWRDIMELVPVGVLARPGQRISARMSPAARQYLRYRYRGREAPRLRKAKAPAWVFVNVPMDDISSSEIRASGGWQKG